MEFRKREQKAHEKSCGAILFKRGKRTRFLLLKYIPGHWGFARGHVEKGESEKETALREIEEETGIRNIRFLAGFRENFRFSFHKNGKSVQKQVVIFLGEAPQQVVRLSGEHLGYLWLTYREAMNRLTHSTAKQVLRKARNYLEASPRRIGTPKICGPRTETLRISAFPARLERETQASKNRGRDRQRLPSQALNM